MKKWGMLWGTGNGEMRKRKHRCRQMMGWFILSVGTLARKTQSICSNLSSNRVQSACKIRKGIRLREQGVVTYTSPVEAFATGIKNLDR